jgi:gluconate 2-dehydrogenase gamma chain
MDRREALKRTAWIMGGIISAPAISGVLNGCTAKPSIDWKPEFLTKEQASLVTQVAEIIIPKTDTPGAKEVGVPSFIDRILKDCYSKEDQDRFLSGLKAFDEEPDNTYGDTFMDLDDEDQLAYVKLKHDAAVREEQEDTKETPRGFILTMKELTMLGYFTSEVGATKVLQYEAVPGAYKGCIPLSEAGNGKAWAT